MHSTQRCYSKKCGLEHNRGGTDKGSSLTVELPDWHDREIMQKGYSTEQTTADN